MALANAFTEVGLTVAAGPRRYPAFEVHLSRSGDVLTVSVPSTGDSIAVLWQLDDRSSSIHGVHNIQFSDGTVWDRSTIAANTWIRGTSGNDRISAPTSGATIDTGLGNDYVDVNGIGGDTIVFAKGDGQDRLDNSGSGFQRSETLDIVDILPSEVQLTRSGDVLTVSVPSTGDSITVLWQFDR
jgi:hypothetical protein